MPVTLLSKGAEILLVQFHEPKGDRVGAQVGDRLPEHCDDFHGQVRHRGLVRTAATKRYACALKEP